MNTSDSKNRLSYSRSRHGHSNQSYPSFDVRDQLRMEEEPYERVMSNRNSQRRPTSENSNSSSFLDLCKSKLKKLFGTFSQPEPLQTAIDEEFKGLDIPPPFPGNGTFAQLTTAQPYQHTLSSLSSERRLVAPQPDRQENKPELNVLNINYYESPLAQRKSKRVLPGGGDETFQDTWRSRNEGPLHSQPNLQQQVDLCLEPINKSRRVKRKESISKATPKKHPNLYAMMEMTQRLGELKLSQHFSGSQRPGFVVNKSTWLSSLINRQCPKPKCVKPIYSEREKKYLPLFQFVSDGQKFNYKIIPGNWPKKRKFAQEDDRMSNASRSNWRQGPEGVFFQNAVTLDRELSGHSAHKKMKGTSSKVSSERGNLERFQLSDYNRMDYRFSRNSPNSTRSRQIYFDSHESDSNLQEEEDKKIEFQREKYADPFKSKGSQLRHLSNEDSRYLEKQNAKRIGEISLSNLTSNNLKPLSNIPKIGISKEFPESTQRPHSSTQQERIHFNLGNSSSISEEKPIPTNSIFGEKKTSQGEISQTLGINNKGNSLFKDAIVEENKSFMKETQKHDSTSQEQNFNLFRETKPLDLPSQKAPAMTLSSLSNMDPKYSLFPISQTQIKKETTISEKEEEKSMIPQKTLNIPPFSEASRLFGPSTQQNSTVTEEKPIESGENLRDPVEIKKAPIIKLPRNIFEQGSLLQSESAKSFNLFETKPLEIPKVNPVSDEAKETLQSKPAENILPNTEEGSTKAIQSGMQHTTSQQIQDNNHLQAQNSFQLAQPTQGNEQKDRINSELGNQKVSNVSQESNDQKNLNATQETSNGGKPLNNQETAPAQLPQQSSQTQPVTTQHPSTMNQPLPATIQPQTSVSQTQPISTQLQTGNLSPDHQKKTIQPTPLLKLQSAGSDDLRKGLESNPFVMSTTNNTTASLQPTGNPTMTLESIIKMENPNSKNLFASPQIQNKPSNLFSNPQTNPNSTLVSNGILFSNPLQGNKPAMEDETSTINANRDMGTGGNLFSNTTNLNGNNLQLPWSNSGIQSTGNLLPQNTNPMIGGANLMSNNGPSNLFMSSSANDMRNEDSQKNMQNNQPQLNLFSNTGGSNGSQLFNPSSNFPSTSGGMLFDNNANRMNTNMQPQNNLFSNTSGNGLQGTASLFSSQANPGLGTPNTFLNNLSSGNPGSGMPNLFNTSNSSNTMGGGNLFGNGMDTSNQSLPNNNGGLSGGGSNQTSNAFLQGTASERTYKILKGIRSNPGQRLNDM